MKPWRAITEGDLTPGKMTSAEYNAVADAIETTIETVVDMVRGYIASAGIDLDTDTTTLPPRLIGPACDVILVDAYKSLGGTLTDKSGERAQAKKDAIRLFEAVRDKKFSIDDPDSGIESTGSGGATVVGSRTPRVTRDNMKGF